MTRLWAVPAAALILSAAAARPFGQAAPGRGHEPDEVVVALALSGGERVADIGAGTSGFTLRLAGRVGPGGRVLAVDTDVRALRELERLALDAGLRNVDTIPAP